MSDGMRQHGLAAATCPIQKQRFWNRHPALIPFSSGISLCGSHTAPLLWGQAPCSDDTLGRHLSSHIQALWCVWDARISKDRGRQFAQVMPLSYTVPLHWMRHTSAPHTRSRVPMIIKHCCDSMHLVLTHALLYGGRARCYHPFEQGQRSSPVPDKWADEG